MSFASGISMLLGTKRNNIYKTHNCISYIPDSPVVNKVSLLVTFPALLKAMMCAT